MKFKVHGFCLVPVAAEIEVEAATSQQAIDQAQAAWDADKRTLIVAGSLDEEAAFDWRPTAEEIGMGEPYEGS